ncbi:uncharacterized protein LOC130998591 [Salvia miltiorrhiza]|uniref:uncharacterized protein LOC130998591 n=1 Tax=Salvia miltiorrhiza TaxID=226208 RepID=UPI0025AC6D39|nr:uncharacterized protein LOC130998591 [Salvia miltiorrhiza]
MPCLFFVITVSLISRVCLSLGLVPVYQNSRGGRRSNIWVFADISIASTVVLSTTQSSVGPFVTGNFLIIGDFNSILGAHERLGRRIPATTPCLEFREFIDDHSLVQPETTGSFFTWTDRRCFPFSIESVLDRDLLYQDFYDLWTSTSVLVLSKLESDHSPILLRCLDSEVMKKLKRLRPALKTWNKEVFGNYNTALTDLQQDLSALQQSIDAMGYSEVFFDQEVALQAEMGTLLMFFHSMVKWRRASHKIKHFNINGVLSDDPATMAAHVVDFYSSLFDEPPSDPVDRSWIPQYIPALVFESDAGMLIKQPSTTEIGDTVFFMDKDSAPGPDGFFGAFFQSAWEIVGEDTIAAVSRFFTHGYIPTGLNANLLCLLPKKSDAVAISNFRPIVLENFFFKILTKILASRLNLVAASIRGVNCLERSLCGRNLALKVDIKKAFDTLNWDFVDTGVRQGDPLSPILFGIAEEVLNRLLLDAAERDDVLIFYRADKRSCVMNDSILQIYAAVPGQACNKAKSTVYFGKGVPTQDGIHSGSHHCPLPEVAGDAAVYGQPNLLGLFSHQQYGGAHIGQGTSVLFWMDNWLGYKLIDKIGIPNSIFRYLQQPISDYYFEGSWHFTLDFLITFPDTAFDIISIPISGIGDRRAWTHSHFGKVASSLALDHLRPSFPSVDWGNWIWAPFILVRCNSPAPELTNKVVFDDVSISATALMVQIKAFILEAARFSLSEMANSVEELLVLHEIGVPGNPRRPTSYVYVFWSPPQHWRKINIDGSVHGSPLSIHVGGIIRDSTSVIGCFHFSAGRSWAFKAELFALIIALE